MTLNVQLQISNVSGFVTDLVCFKYVFEYVCLLGIGTFLFVAPHRNLYEHKFAYQCQVRYIYIAQYIMYIFKSALQNKMYY